MVLDPQTITLATSTVIYTSIFAIIAISLNIEYGYAGLPNFGKVLPVLGGAIVAGSLMPQLIQALIPDAPRGDYIANSYAMVNEFNSMYSANPILGLLVFVLGLGLAALVGGALGFIALLPTLRLRADYLAITLIVIAEFFRAVANNYDPLINGPRGVAVPNPLAWTFEISQITYFYVSIIFLVATLLFVEYLLRSPFGRALKAMREDELSAQTVGINIYALRIRALVIGSMLASVAGYLNAHYIGSVTVETFNRNMYTFMPWLIVILGGAGNNFGVVVASAVFVLFYFLITNIYKEMVRDAISFMVNSITGLFGVSVDMSWVDPNRIGFIMFAVAMLLILYFRPQGILPEGPIKTRGLIEAFKMVSRKRGSGG